MPKNLVDGSKEIIMKLNFFTERGFVEDQKGWDEKLSPILDVTEILLQLIPCLINKDQIKTMSDDPDQEMDFKVLRMKFARLLQLFVELSDQITEVSGGTKFDDELNDFRNELTKRNESNFNALMIGKKQLEEAENSISVFKDQKLNLESLHTEILRKSKQLESLKDELTHLLKTDTSLQTRISDLLNQVPLKDNSTMIDNEN